MGELYVIPGKTDVEPDILLRMAAKWDSDELVIIGINKDGEVSLASTSCNTRDVISLIEIGKDYLFKELI